MRRRDPALTHPYASEAYARALPHLGDPVFVPEWGTFVLSRPTPDGMRHDAVGSYPITVLAPDADLEGGLDRLRSMGFVSVTMVVDDHHRPLLQSLETAFDIARPFKTHYIHDASVPGYGKHHRYEVRRARRRVEVSEIALGAYREAWASLYSDLTARHGLSGTHAFPAIHHDILSTLPGVRTFGAFLDGSLVSAHVFVVHGVRATSHLAASSPAGYANGAAYAVNDAALLAFKGDYVLNLGGAAGAGDDPADSLARFKRGFSNRTASSHLCGKALDPAAYAAMSLGRGTAFFPAYRSRRSEEPGETP